mmetsp:Transcript_66825/g.118323  ORF Transcript_66825/g.118323 Transcript_66825/m.118323 type:complete len:542 (+) Transcript_66825:50-1675(+)
MLGQTLQSLGVLKPQKGPPETSEQAEETLLILPSAPSRRLRQVSQIAVRSLPAEHANGYVLEVALDGEALDRSDPLNTRNPTWSPGCGIGDFRSFEVRAVGVGDGDGHVLWKHTVDLPSMEILCEDLESLPAGRLPQQSPLVQLNGRWLAAKDSLVFHSTEKSPTNLRRRPGQTPKQVQTLDLCLTADQISVLCDRLHSLRAHSRSLQKSIEQSLQASSHLRKCREQQVDLERRLSRLRSELRARQEGLASLRGTKEDRSREEPCGPEHRSDGRRGQWSRWWQHQAAEAAIMASAASRAAREDEGAKAAQVKDAPSAVETPHRDVGARSGVVPSGLLLAKRQQWFSLAKTQLEDAQTWLCEVSRPADAAASANSQMQWQRLRCRQISMLHELSQIFQIQDLGSHWVIRGLAVVSMENLKRQDLREEEDVSTALGYLAHLLATLALLLQVPLQVAVRRAGASKSCLIDESGFLSNGARQKEWPLHYSRNLDKSKFETALRLLQDALHHFLYSRGYSKRQGCNLLECTHLILQQEIYGCEGSG